MKPSTFLQIVILCLLSTLANSQEQNEIPDSLPPIIKASKYFVNSQRAVDHSNDPEKALEYFIKGYEIAKELKNDSLIHVSHYYKGIIIAARGKDYFDEAEEVFKDALEPLLKSGNNLVAGKVCIQLGALALKRGDFDTTEKYYNLAYDYIINSKHPASVMTPLYNLSIIYKNHKKYDQAVESAKKVDEMYTIYQLDKPIIKVDITKHKIKYLVGICYVNLNKYDLGMKIVNNTLKVFKEQEYYLGVSSVFYDLRDYQIEKGDFAKALSQSDSIIKYDQLRYEKSNKKTNAYIDNIKTMENISLQLDLANKEIELKEEKNTKLTRSLILAGILILSLFAISILLKQKNSTLKFLKARAEDGEREKSKFIAMISHEIRTPLNALLGFSNLLLEENPEEHQKKHINSIVSSADYLLNLVNNVLNLNDSSNGELIIENHPINMESFINNLANSFFLQTSNRSNKLTVNYDSKIPKKLKSDSLKIAQILKNLLNNACKFTTDGNIWLNVTLFENNNDHCMVNFEVKDTGEGIPKEKFKSIFEAFSKDSFNIKKKHDGFGIGLSIVQKLLNAFESEILIESEVNKGSSFSFVLKMYKLPQEVLPSNEAAKKTLKGKHVLVVEDNKINQILAAKMLKSADVIPDISANGLIGFETFKSKPIGYYNLILMDIHMPVMDGYEATKLIRNIDANIPIVALTATNLANNKEILDKKGLNAVIYKPYEVARVYEVMDELILHSKK